MAAETKQIFDQLTQQTVTFQVIHPVETVNVLGETLTTTHEYWVPQGQAVTDEAAWLEPKDDVDRNLQADYALFRQAFHFLTPAEIKANRLALHLTLRETAAALGMSFSTLSDIENGRLLQSMDQEVKLRYLAERPAFGHFVAQHATIIGNRLTRQGVNAPRFFEKLAAHV